MSLVLIARLNTFPSFHNALSSLVGSALEIRLCDGTTIFQGAKEIEGISYTDGSTLRKTSSHFVFMNAHTGQAFVGFYQGLIHPFD